MTHAVAVEVRDDALILTFQNGPSNALTAPVRAELIARIEAAGPPCRRILLTSAGPGFSSAVPLDPDPQRPTLAELCTAVERSHRPVIAVLTGLVLGAGAELALAARGRVAAPDMRLAFPEVALGLCPEGGSTLRLPRLIGTEAALDLLLSGRPIRAEEALTLGLVDHLSPIPVAEALSLLTLPARHSRVRAEPAVIAKARRTRPGALPAVQRLIACVEAAALLPETAHLAFEAVAREDLEASPEAAALRAVTRADRRAAQLPPWVARLRPPTLTRLALYGADPALTALAKAALARGLTVAWHHPDPVARAASLELVPAADRDRLIDLENQGDDPATLQIHAARPPTSLRRGTGVAHLVMQGAEGEIGLALAPKGKVCELALPSEGPSLAPQVALAVAGLRALGWQPVLVGRLPVLGQRLASAADAAFSFLQTQGISEGQIAHAVADYGVVAQRQADPATIPADMIQARWLSALANEGLRLLDQGLARRPSDLDLLMVLGQGFPRWRGGPMHQADRRGLMALRRDLRSWAADDPIWTPAPLLDRLIQDGLRLADLNLG